MSSGAEVSLGVISRLPRDVQEVLKRKSSRDPNSRFTSKLATLLQYVTRFPATEEEIGVGWVDELTFKMKKRALTGILGIKLNTLNVNLRDLKFVQQSNTAKDGWAYWQKEGFTRSLAPALAEEPRPEFPSPRQTWPFSLGRVVPDAVAQFFRSVDHTWRELTGPECVQVIETQSLLQRAARHFKQDGQQEQNALDVLTAIIAPKKMDVVTFAALARFLAMFGPDRTVMLKIASLLECSHRTGQWLYFDTEGTQLPALSGSFDPQEPNCLVIRNNGVVSRAWNAPLIEANGKRGYVTDEVGNIYASWADYFKTCPVMRPFGDILYPY
jgi:hypothetical protein